MNIRLFAVLMIALLLVPMISGCSLFTLGARVDALEDKVEDRVDAVEDKVENAVIAAVTADTGAALPQENSGAAYAPAPRSDTAVPNADAEPAAENAQLTQQEAQNIALEHAGLTADQVTHLRIEYEIDDGSPQYEVQFRLDRWEYEYDIHAETGKILSYDRDD